MLASRPWLGYVLGVLAAIGFSTASVFSKIAFDSGTNPTTLLVMRSTTAAIAVWLFLRLVPAPEPMPWERRIKALVLGLILALYSYGLVSSLVFIPVPLAVLIFYTYPLLTALLSWTTGSEKMSLWTIGALLMAFGGLMLALDVTGNQLNPTGIAFAGLGAVSMSILAVLSKRLIGDGDSRPVTLHMLITAIIAFCIIATLTDRWALPGNAMGWIGLGTSVSLYSFAIITFFVVIATIGPVRTGLIMNTEPVNSVVVSAIVLSQFLGPWQIAGCGLVVLAVVLIRLRQMREVGPG